MSKIRGSVKVLEHLEEMLKEICEHGPYKSFEGLCHQIIYFLDDARIDANIVEDAVDVLHELVVDWAKANGRSCMGWPIEDSLVCYQDNMRKWDKDTEHGALRWKMVRDVLGVVRGRLKLWEELV